MSDNNGPYLERQPGDLITAEDWNELQGLIKGDIRTKVDNAKQEVREGSVKKAEDADRLEGESGGEWLEKLDERYAPKHHEHEGQSVYRRYIKHFESGVNQVFLEHNLGRYPLVDVYELQPVPDEPIGDGEPGTAPPCKILVYYGHGDTEKYGLLTKVYRDKAFWGYPLTVLLDELDVPYPDEKILEDVINDLWEAFMRDPNDEISHCVSPWIKDKCNKKRTVGELKSAGQWEDLKVALNPVSFCLCASTPNRPLSPVKIGQVNYNTLHIEVPEDRLDSTLDDGRSQAGLDLMFLLRI